MKVNRVKSAGLFSCQKEEAMPHKPKKPCAYPGCPNLTDETYCEVHKNMVAKQYNKFQRSLIMQKSMVEVGNGFVIDMLKLIRFVRDV